ncbi:MAG TPA: TerC family protein [Alphaproteobacteria bacterium]|nr:hypothetical protein [Rhodospirillaceae bacterium]HRJ13134.1 TerC family protein [Alphaproteobacteria bacterium]
MFEFTPEIIAALLTLTALEVVLGFDNLVLIAILTERLPEDKRPLARRLGLIFALISRLALLSLIFVMAQLSEPFLFLFGYAFSWRELLLIAGGLFLLAKGTLEIHHKIEDKDDSGSGVKKFASMQMVIIQIAIMDIVFSFDSVMTAIGVAEQLWVMVTAILISMAVMVLAINKISDFIGRHPTVKVLALSYMLLIGMALIGEGFHAEIPKGYLYFAMAFSFLVEIINMVIRNRAARRASSGQHPG